MDLSRGHKIVLAVAFVVAVVYLAWHGGYFGVPYSAVGTNAGMVLRINIVESDYIIPAFSSRTYHFRWGVGSEHELVFQGVYAFHGIPAPDSPYYIGLKNLTVGGVAYQTIAKEFFNVSFQIDGMVAASNRFGDNKAGLGYNSATGLPSCCCFPDARTNYPWWDSCGVAVTEYAVGGSPCCGTWVEHTLTVVNNEPTEIRFAGIEFLYPNFIGYNCDEVEGYADYSWYPKLICPIPDSSRKNGENCWFDVQCASGYCDVWSTSPGRCATTTTTTTSTIPTTMSTTTAPKTTSTFPATTTTPSCVSDCGWTGCSGNLKCEEIQPGCFKKRVDAICGQTTTTTPTTTMPKTTTTLPTTTTIPNGGGFLTENVKYLVGGIGLLGMLWYVLSRKPTT